MTLLRKFGALALLLASLLTPAMACGFADSSMTAEERACCQMMKVHCSQEQMPASHHCCDRIPGNVYDHALKVKADPSYSALVQVAWIPAEPFELFAISDERAIAEAKLLSLDFPPSTFSVLRI